MTTPTTPPATQVASLGDGINTFTGAVLPTAISASASTVNSLGLSSQWFVKICDSVESFNKASSLSAGLTAAPAPAPTPPTSTSTSAASGESGTIGDSSGTSGTSSGSASSDNSSFSSGGITVGVANNLNINDTSVSVMVYAMAQTSNTAYGSCSLADGIVVPMTKEESLAFYQQYGDSYVAGLTEGGEYTALFVFYCQTDQDKKSLTASLTASGVVNVNGKGINIGGSLSGGLSETIITSNIRCSIYQTLLGSSLSVPVVNTGIESFASFVSAIVNFAENFNAASVDQAVVIGYETQAYETLFGDTLSPGFQAIAGNRGIYLGSVGPDLIALQTMQNKYQWLQQAYNTYGFTGDTALATNYTQLTSDIAGLGNWLNTGGWNTAMFLTNAASGGIAQVEFNGQLVMAFIGEYQQITLCASSDQGHAWSYPVILPGLCSNFPPALAVCDNQLYLAYTGLESTIYRCYAESGFDFSTPSPCGGSSLSGPSLAVGLTFTSGKETDSTVYVAYADPTGQVCVEFRDGILQTGYYTVVGVNPALTTVGNTLYLAFSTTSPTAGVGNCLAYCCAPVPSNLAAAPVFGAVTYVNTSGPVGACLNLVGVQFNLYATVDTTPLLYAAWANDGQIMLWNLATNHCNPVATGGLPSLAAADNVLALAYLPPVTGKPVQIAMQTMTMPVSTESFFNGSGGIALAEFNGLKLMAFVGAYQQITVCTSTDNGQTWGGATVLNRVFSNFQPALAVFNSQLYLAFTGLDSAIHICSSSDGEGFSSPATINGCASSYAPSLAVAGGELNLAFTGEEGICLVSTSDGVNFSGLTPLPSGYEAYSNPALAVAGGSLWVAFVAGTIFTGYMVTNLSYGSASISGTTVGSFSEPTPVMASTMSESEAESGISLSNVSLVDLFGNLYAAWSNGNQIMLWDGRFNVCSEAFVGGLPTLTTTSDGTLLLAYVDTNTEDGMAQISLADLDVSYPFSIPANASGGLSPVVAFYDQCFVAYISAYQQITLRASSDGGQNWDKPMMLKDMASNYPPTLAAYNGRLCLAYTGLDNTLYITASSDGVNFLNPPVQFYQTANPAQPNTSYAGPSFSVANGLLYLAFTDTNRQLNVASASDGINFTDQILTGFYSSSNGINPALAALGGSLWVAYAVATAAPSGNSLGFISTVLDASPLTFSTPQNSQYVQSGTIGGYLSFASFSGNLYAVWQTTSGIVGWNSVTNSCSEPLPGGLPALAVCGAELMLAYAPDAAGNAGQSVSFATMSAPSLLSTPWTSTAYPLMTPGLGGYAQVEFNGQQVMALLGEGGQIYLSSSPDGQNWSNLTAPANACSNFPPALAVFGNQLVLAFTSNGSGGLFNNGLYSCYYGTGASFSTPVQVGSTGVAGAILGQPALAVASGALYLGFIGTDQQLNLASSANGTSFGTPQTLGCYATCGANPGLAATDADVYFGFAADSSCYTSAPGASNSPDSLALLNAPVQSSGGIGSFGAPSFVATTLTGNLSLTVLGNNLYAAWQNGSETWLWNQFANNCTSSKTSVQQPTLTTVGGQLALACGKPKSVLNFSTLSGGVWGTASIVSASTASVVEVPALATNGGFALAEFNGALYLAYVGPSQQIYVCSSSKNGKWGTATAITNAYSAYPPALAAFNDQLVLAFKATSSPDNTLTDGILYSSYSSTGASFSAPSYSSTARYSQAGPALAVAGGLLYLGYIGTDQQLKLTYSSDGESFYSFNLQLPQVWSPQSANPALAATNTTLYFGFAVDSSCYTSVPSASTSPDSLAVLIAPILPSGGIGSFGAPQFYTFTISAYLSLAAISGVLYASWADGSGNIYRWCQTGAVVNGDAVVGTQPTLAAVGGDLALIYNTTNASESNETMLMTMPAFAASNPAYLPGSGAAAASGLFALVEFNGQVVMAFADGSGQMFTAASSDGKTWSSPSALTGTNSRNTPALAVFNSQLYLAYTGTDDNLYVCSTSDGATLGSPAQIAGATSHGLAGPSLAAAGGLLYLFFTQPNLYIWMVSSSDGSTWGTPDQLPSGYIASTPNVANTAAVVYNDKLYLAFSAYFNGYSLGIGNATIGTSGVGSFISPNYHPTGLVGSALSMAATTANGLCIAWQQPNGTAVVWSDVSTTNSALSVTASSPPALAVVNGELLLAYAAPQSNPSLISLRTAWSPSWNAPNFGLWNVPGYKIGDNTCSALTVFNGQPFMAYTDANNTINVCSSSDGGQTWGRPTVLSSLTTGQPPALAVFKGQLYLAYTGSGNTLYVCASGDGINFASPTALNASSSSGPALAAAGNSLYLAFTAFTTSGKVFPLGLFSTSDGVSFSACPALPSGYASFSPTIKPALAVSGGSLYLAFAASSTSLGYGSAEIGTSGLGSFATLTSLAVSTIDGYLSLAEQAGSLFASWYHNGDPVVWNQSTGTCNNVQTSYSSTATNAQPSLSVWENDLVLTYVSTNGLGSSLNLLPLPIAWNPQWSAPGYAVWNVWESGSVRGYALAEHNNQLYMAFNNSGLGQGSLFICWTTNQGQTWSRVVAIDGCATTQSTALETFNGQLYLAFTNQYNVYLAVSSDGETFGSPVAVINNSNVQGPPALAVAGGLLCLGYTIWSTGEVYLTSSADGKTFDTPQDLGFSSRSNVALAALNDTLFVGNTGSDTSYSPEFQESTTIGWIGLRSASVNATSGVGSWVSVGTLQTGSSVPANISLTATFGGLYYSCEFPSGIPSTTPIYQGYYDVESGYYNHLQIATGTSPAQTVANGQLALAYQNANSQACLIMSAGDTWSSPWKLPTYPVWDNASFNIATSSSFAVAEFGSQLILAYTDATTTISVCVSLDQGQTWCNPISIGLTTAFPPALAVFNGQLYLAYTSTTGYLMVCVSSNGISFGAPTQFGSGAINAGPALAATGGSLYLAFTGADAKLTINLTWLSSGTSFGEQILLPFTSASASVNPALAVMQGNLYLAFAGTSSSAGGSCLGIASTALANTCAGSFSSATYYATGAIGGCLSLAASAGNLNAAWELNGTVYTWSQSTGNTTQVAKGNQPLLATCSGNEAVLAYCEANAAVSYGINFAQSYSGISINPTQQPHLSFALSPPQSLMIGSPVFNYRPPSQPIWGGNGGGPFQDINVGVAGLSATASSSATTSLNGSANVAVQGHTSPSAFGSFSQSAVTNASVPIAISNLPVIISITLWGGDWMNQIQTSYQSQAGVSQFTHGGSGGDASNPLTLASGEFISGIDGSSGNYVNLLSLTTTKGQSLSWPTKPDSASNFIWALPSGTNLVGFQGHGGTYLDQLQPVVIDIQPARWMAASLQPLPYATVLPVSKIGVGYDSFSGSALPNSALDPNVSVVGSQGVQSGSDVKVCTSVESLSQSLTKSSGFSIGIGKFKLGYNKTKTKTLNVTDTSVSVVVVAKAVVASPVYTAIALSESVSAMSLPALLTEYGDAFVSSTVNGGEYVAVFVYDCQSVSEQQSVTRSLTAGLEMDNYQVGASLGSTLASAQSSTNVNCTCHQSLAGSTTALPVLTSVWSTDVVGLVNFASGFSAADVNTPVVLSYLTTGYEALLPSGSVNTTAFQTVVGNRGTFLSRVVPTLSRLYGIWSQVEALQAFYATYGYTGDPEISQPVKPGSKAGQVAAAINGLNQWLNNTIANPLQPQPLGLSLNPPPCLSYGVPSLAYPTATNPLWGTSPTTPFQDINLGVQTIPTNPAFDTNPSGPAAIPLTSLPVLSAISLWGGDYVDQMATTYTTKQSGPTTFTYGKPNAGADYALNLEPGEYITMIRGDFGDYINQLIFSTSLGQNYSYPPNAQATGGVIFWQAGSGEVLVGFQGSSGVYLNQLQPITIKLQPAVWTPPLIVEPVAVDVPPVTGLGVGYNTFTGGAMPNSAIIPPDASTIGSQNVKSKSYFQICTSLQSLDQTVNGLNFNVSAGGQSAAHKKTQSMQVSNTSVSVVVYANLVTQSLIFTSAAPPTLNTAAEGLTPTEFFTAYGDTYVSSVVQGAEYVAVLVYDCQTETEQASTLKSLNTSLKVDVDGVPVTLGTSFSSDMVSANASTNMQVRIYQWLNGSASALPPINATAGTSVPATMATAISGVSNFALNPSTNAPAFTVDGNGAVLAFASTGYETLMSSTGAKAFQPIVSNREAYFSKTTSSNNVTVTAGISVNLNTLAAIRKQMQFIANIYQSFGYTGDSAFASNCQQLNEDTAALANWVNQVNANPTGSYSYPNPPASVTNGMPSLQYNPPAMSASWGGTGGGAWYDLASSASANTTNQSNNPSNPVSPIPLSEQPVLAAIVLWGQDGGCVNQIGTSYQTNSGTIQFVHGASSGCAAPSLNLRAGEFITEINSTSGDYVNQLSFTTNFGQSLTWPASPQSTAVNPAWQASDGEVLVGFQGSCGSHLNQLSPVCITFKPASWSSV